MPERKSILAKEAADMAVTRQAVFSLGLRKAAGTLMTRPYERAYD
jgi:hypothetical protein